MNIADQRIPGLSSRLQALSLERRRRVISKACEMVSRSVVDGEPTLYTFLHAAIDGNSLTAAQLADARSYAAAADERYMTLKEQGADEFVWRNWFAKARLATALAAGFGGTTSDESADAIYELCFVEEDDSELIELVDRELRVALDAK